MPNYPKMMLFVSLCFFKAPMVCISASTKGDCLNSPERCDCFSYFGLDPLKQADREDVKQGHRAFARKWHPDKHRQEKDGREQMLMFANACKEFLQGDRLKSYGSRLKAIYELARKKSWTESQRADRIEELHEEFGIGAASRSPDADEPMTPRFTKRESPTEKMHIFLDNSVSFQCGLEEAAETLDGIFPRLERTPTSVHLMSTRPQTKQLFSESDDFVMDDVMKHWTAKEAQPESLDVLFVMDITGSMSSAISAAKEKVVEIGFGLQHRFKVVRIGFLGYRDMDDSEQFQMHGFTQHWSNLQSWIMDISADGGGDFPENVIGAIELASRNFDWEAEKRLLVHIFDAPAHAPRPGQERPEFWLRELAEKRVEYAMLQVGDGAQDTVNEYEALFNAASPVSPMLVMGVSDCTADNFKGAVMDAAFEATPHAKGTFMWEYIFEQLSARAGRDHEVVIFTDGHDNASNERFRGTEGFNYMMELLKDLGMSLPRITVICFCNAECTKGKYKELAMASGGRFFSASEHGAKAAFTAHMLLSHAERLAMAKAQKMKYEQITQDGHRFGWYMPVTVSSAGGQPGGGAWGLTCREVNGAQVCSKKTRTT